MIELVNGPFISTLMHPYTARVCRAYGTTTHTADGTLITDLFASLCLISSGQSVALLGHLHFEKIYIATASDVRVFLRNLYKILDRGDFRPKFSLRWPEVERFIEVYSFVKVYFFRDGGGLVLTGRPA